MPRPQTHKHAQHAFTCPYRRWYVPNSPRALTHASQGFQARGGAERVALAHQQLPKHLLQCAQAVQRLQLRQLLQVQRRAHAAHGLCVKGGVPGEAGTEGRGRVLIHAGGLQLWQPLQMHRRNYAPRLVGGTVY